MKEKCRYIKVMVFSSVINTGLRTLLAINCLMITVFVTSCQINNKDQMPENTNVGSLIYYCPMHPEVQQDHPGKCPKPECMGMDLILKTADTLLENVLNPVNTSVLASVKTIKPGFKKIILDFESSGYIDYDTRTKHDIASRFNGRIEKLYVKYNYQPVRKGEKVLEIYSAEIVTAQENYVYLLKNDSGAKELIDAAKNKLRFLDFTDDLLDELTKTQKVMMRIPVYSMHDGHVRENSEEKMMDGFQKNMGLSVKEGMYVEKNQTVFNLLNPANIAVKIQLKPMDIPKISLGQEVEIQVETDNVIAIRGKVDFIEPQFKEGAKTMTAIVYIDNSKYNFKIGSLVKARVKKEGFETLWIPSSAMVDLGKDKIVWLKKNKNFVAVRVETGTRSNSMIEIIDGLTEEDDIALEGHYLTDSEGFVKINKDEE